MMVGDASALKRFLAECPQAANFHFDSSVRCDIRKALFSAVSDGGRHLDHFPPLDTQGVESEWDLGPFNDPHRGHPNRPCARVFLKGEPIYRCLTCSLDETCAMCSDCYDAEAHKDHQVSINICMRSSNGGICDCGDPEAWVSMTPCVHYHKKQKPDEALPSSLASAILATLEVALDYVIDVMSGADICFLSLEHDPAALVAHSQACALDPHHYYNYVDGNSLEYVLVLYNDYVRHYRDAVQRIHMATRRVPEFAEMVATEIESRGKAIVCRSADLSCLIQHQQTLGATGLHSTIRSARDSFREEMCDEIVKWLKTFTESTFFQDFSSPRDLFSRVICSKWGHGHTRRPTFAPYQTGRMDNGLIPIIPLIPSVESPSYWHTEPKRWDLPETISRECGYNLAAGKENDFEGEPFVGLRFQHLLYFDIRFANASRVILHDIYVTAVISNLTYKNTISCQYVDIYPSIADMFLRIDREPEISLMCDLSTQLFTTPTDSTVIVKHGDLTRILSTIYGFLTGDAVAPPCSVDLSKQALLLSLRNRKWGQIFFDLVYIVLRNAQSHLIFEGNFVRQACDVIALFQSRPVVVRAATEHVEFESSDYTLYFTALSVLSRFCEAVARAASRLSAADAPLMQRTIQTVMGLLSQIDAGAYPGLLAGSLDVGLVSMRTWKGFGVTEAVSEYPVHTRNVSFVHPLHSFLSWLLEKGSASPAGSVNLVAFANRHYAGAYKLLPYDYALRSLVFLAQVRVGFWVRNGFSIKNQLHIYRNTNIRECGFMRDVFLCQTMAASFQPDEVCLLFLYRWSLVLWAQGQTAAGAVYDLSTLLGVVEECVNFFVWMVNEDTHLRGLDQDGVTRAIIKREVVHALCFQPLSYSKIVAEVPEHVVNLKKFDTVLQELAVYTPPAGLNDAGVYRLKETHLDEVDPYFIHLTSNKRDDAIKLVKERVSKRTRRPLAEVAIEPVETHTSLVFAGVANFTTSILFAAFVGSTLSYALSGDASNLEAIIDATLHLVHICALGRSVTATERSFYNFMMETPVDDAALALVPHSEQRRCSVAGHLCCMLASEGFAHYHFKIRRIFSVFVARYPSAIPILSEAYPCFNETLAVERTGGAVLDKQRLAKERRERVMAEFKRKQSQFLAVNSVDSMEDTDVEMLEEDTMAWRFPEEHCILCQMPREDEEFGIISHVSSFAGFRNVPFNNPYWLAKAFSGEGEALESDAASDATTAFLAKVKAQVVFGPGFPSTSSDTVESRSVLTSCGHGMHFGCYKNYLVSVKSRHHQITRTVPENPEEREFLCPLCKAVNNMFVPVLWSVNNRPMARLLTEAAPLAAETGSAWHAPFDHLRRVQSDAALEAVTHAFRAELVGVATHGLKPKYASFFQVELGAVQQCVGVLDQVFENLLRLDPGFAFDGDFTALVVNTIESVEIALRGVEAEGQPLYAQLSHQVLTNLRVWTELRSLNAAMQAVRPASNLPSFVDDVVAHYQILAGEEMCVQVAQGADLFESLVGCLINESVGLTFCGAVRMCLVWHVIQSAHGVISLMLANPTLWERVVLLPVLKGVTAADAACAMALFHSFHGLTPTVDVTPLVHSPAFGAVLYSMVVRCAMPFLRRCALWAFVQCDDQGSLPAPQGSPLADLCALLQLPSLSEVVAPLAVSGTYESERLGSFVGWLERHPVVVPKVEYPGVVALIDLPDRMDDFFTRYYYKDLNHHNADPAVCLFCGAVVQLQGSVIGSRLGQCNLHVERECISECGIFLVPRYCTFLLLAKGKGSFYKAPYLDPHGELDEEPRQGKRLILSQQRYDAFIRNIWLNHGFLNAIARSLESVIDVGGWETM